MPNWIEGTMKLRGKREDIKRFFNERVEGSSGFTREESVEDRSNENELEFIFKNEPWVEGTRRMFIKDGDVFMLQDEGVCCVNIKQAWSFSSREEKDLEVLQEIADKFHIDIRLYGIECGVEFVQEVIVRHCDENRRSPRIINNCIQYENWDWDCPFPNMGG